MSPFAWRVQSLRVVCACTIDINNSRELLSVKTSCNINYFFAGECRTLKFESVIQDRVLIGHVLKSYVVDSKDDCELKCYMEADCMSISLGLEANGKYLCELSDSDHDMHPKDLEVRYGFIYGPTKVIFHAFANLAISIFPNNSCTVCGINQADYCKKKGC